ncbi:MAG: serine hydrolase domain-containing protein [Cytophagales bacterium]|nr:serine hydrolase domain-containing protein [Cytophagales bacterium]
MKTITLFMLMTILATSCDTSSNGFDELDAPAIFYGAVSQDSVLCTYKKGNLSITNNQAINKHSQFALFSITKTFTAIGIMQLVESGGISLDDPAIKHLPQYEFLGEITIRHLLTHQSGINNPLPIRWIHLAENDDTFDFDEFNNKILTQKAKVKSEAGSKAAYSNLNFILLGDIISKISGLSYQEYITQNVLNNDEVGFQWKENNVVTGYHRSGIRGLMLGFLMDKKKFTEPKTGGFIPFKKINLNGSAYGGLLASPNGLNIFLQELLSSESQILSKEMRNAMFTQQPLSNEKPSGHSLGWFTGSLSGEKYVHHAGGGGGYYLEMRIYPEKGIATYLLTNKSGFSDQRILGKLDAQHLDFK